MFASFPDPYVSALYLWSFSFFFWQVCASTIEQWLNCSAKERWPLGADSTSVLNHGCQNLKLRKSEIGRTSILKRRHTQDGGEWWFSEIQQGPSNASSELHWLLPVVAIKAGEDIVSRTIDAGLLDVLEWETSASSVLKDAMYPVWSLHNI